MNKYHGIKREDALRAFIASMLLTYTNALKNESTEPDEALLPTAEETKFMYENNLIVNMITDAATSGIIDIINCTNNEIKLNLTGQN